MKTFNIFLFLFTFSFLSFGNNYETHKPLAFTADASSITLMQGGTYTFSIDANNVSTNATGDFNFSGSNQGPIAKVIIRNSPGFGTLKYNGSAVSDNDEITVADINAGLLVFDAGANSGTTTFDFALIDSKASPNTTADAVMTINVTPNDPPTIPNDGTVAVNEDNTYTFAAGDFPYNDPDGNPFAGIEITAITINVSDILFYDANSNGYEAGEEVVVGDQFSEIEVANLKFTPTANLFGTPYANFKFKVFDGTVYSTTTKFMYINVNSVNDPPTSSDKTITTSQETNYTLKSTDFVFTDVESSAFNKIMITTLETNGRLLYNGVDVTLNQEILKTDIDLNKLVFSPDAGESGNPYTTFQYRISDGTDYSAVSYTITVNVTLINQEPSFSIPVANQAIVVNEDSPAFTLVNFAQSITCGNATEDALPQGLTFYLSHSGASLFDVGGQPAVSDVGTLTFTVAPDQNNSSPLTVNIYLKDDGGTANGGDDTSPMTSFTIKIDPVNDAPIINNQSFSVDEDAGNGAVVGTVEAEDIDGDALTYSITGGNTGTAFSIDNTGLLTVNAPPGLNFEGPDDPYSLTIQVKDPSLVIDNGTITVIVNDVNDVPATIDPASFNILENSSNGTSVGTVTFDNSPEFDPLTFTIIGGNTNSAFGINATTGQIYVANSSAVDYESTAPTHQFLLNVQIDDGVHQNSAIQTITVINGNDPPRFTTSPTTVVAVGNAYVYNFTTLDDDGPAPITLSYTTLPDWLSFTDNGDGTGKIENLVGRPDITDVGSHTVVLKTADAALPAASETQSFTIFVASSSINVPTVAHPTIQSAIDDPAVLDGTVISVDASGSPYNENINFNGKNIAIIGDAADPTNVVINGGGNGSVVTFDSGENSGALLQGFTITNGTGTFTTLSGGYNGEANYGGGIYINGSSPSLENLYIYNNTAPAEAKRGGSGGGIFIANGSNPKLENVEVFNNYAEEYRGGGICVNNSSVTIKNSSIYNNSTESYGAGLSLWNSTATLDNVTLSGNQANGVNGAGGAIFIIVSTLNLTNVSINGNSATDGSSGVYDYGSIYNGSYSGGDSHVDIE